MPRFVPIVITADDRNAQAVVRGLTNAFERLDQAADHTSSGGMRNAFIQADLVSRALSFVGREALALTQNFLSTGIGYERAMNLFQVSTRATEQEMRRAAQAAQELGADTTLPATSAADAALAMNELGKANFTASESIDAARGVLQLAAAAHIDEAQAAQINANALNTFNLAAKESERVSDLLAASANASSAEITDNAQAMQQAGAVYASAKVPIEDLITLISEMANAGIKGSDAGTSLKTMLVQLQAPTKEGAALMKEYGLEVFDAQGKLKPFRQIIEDFSSKLSSLTDEQKAQAVQTIFGTDAMRAALIIFGQGTQAYDQMREAVTRQGAAAELAAAQTKGVGGAWEALKSQAESAGLVAFNFLAPVLTFILNLINQYPSVFGAAAGAIGLLIIATKLYNAELTISTLLQSPLIKGLQSVIFWMVHLQTALTDTRTAFTALTGWLGLIVVAGYGLVKWLSSYESATDAAIKITQQNIEAQGKSIEQTRAAATDVEALAGKQSLSTQEHERLNAALTLLDPTTQTYIKTLKDEKQVVDEVTGAIRDKLNKEKSVLEAQALTVGRAVIEESQAIDAQGGKIADLNNRITEWKEKLALGKVSQNEANYAVESFSNQISQAQKTIDDQLIPALNENSLKLLASAQALGLNRDQMIQLFQAAGFTEPQLQKLREIYDQLTQAANNNAAATDNTTNAIDQQAASVRDLRKELADLARVPQEKIDAAVLDIVKNAKNKTEARRMAQEALKTNQELTQATQESRRIREATEAARGVFEPSSRGGGSGGIRHRREREAREGSAAIGLEALRLAESAIGVREIGGRNRGPEVKKYLESVGLDQGQQWCASFVSYFIKGAEQTLKTKSPFPKTASTEAIGKWARENNRFIDEPVPGSVFLEYGRRKGRFAEQHTGFVESYDPVAGTFTTVEGNYRNKVDSVTRKIDPSRYRFVKVDDRTKTDTLDEQRVLFAVTELMRSAGFVPKSADGRSQGFKPDPSFMSPAISTTDFDPYGVTPQLKLSASQQAVQDYHEELVAREKATAGKRVEIEAWVNMRKREVADEWSNEITDRTIRLGELEERMAFLRIENADNQMVEQRRLLKAKEEQYGLEQKLTDLQDELATGPYNQALRQQVTMLEAINDLRRRDEEAINDQIRAQVELADATAFHAEQARAQILDHFARQKSLTDSVADSVTSIADRAGDAVERALGKVDRLFGGLFSNLARLAINRVFMRILDAVLPTSSAGSQPGLAQTGGGGGGGGGIGGFFSNLLGGLLRPGGTAPFNPNSVASMANALTGGDGIAAPVSIGERSAKATELETIIHSATKGGAAAAPSSSLTSALLSSLASAGPAALVAYGAQVLSDAFSGNMSNKQALLSGGLLPFFINRSALRRKEEKFRTELSGKVYEDTIAILNATRAGDMTLADATSQFNQVKANYFAGVAQMKDSKTKRHATQWWDNDFYPFYWPLIQQGAADATQHKVNDDQLIPEFRDGGATWRRFADGGTFLPQFAGELLPHRPLGMTPGPYTRTDPYLARFDGNEVILNPSQWQPIVPILSALDVPGFDDGGAMPDVKIPTLSASSNRSEDKTPIHITANISFDGEEFVIDTMESDAGRAVTFETMSSYEGQKVTKGNYKGGRRKGSVR